jgi:hypothetical protein
METDKFDLFPELCLSFSPNWYSNQILCISSDGLAAYGSNDEVYIVNVREKRIVTSVSLKNQELLKIKEANLKKISSVLITEKHVFLTNVYGYIGIFERSGNDINPVFADALGLHKEIAYIRLIEYDENGICFALSDAESYVCICYYSAGELKKTVIRRKGKPTKIKWFNVIKWKSLNIIVFYTEEGTIELWDQKMKEQIFMFSTKKKVVSCDILHEGDHLYIACYTKASQLSISELSLKKLLGDMVKQDSGNVICEKINIDVGIDQGSSNSRESKFTSHNVLWLDMDSVL